MRLSRAHPTALAVTLLAACATMPPAAPPPDAGTPASAAANAATDAAAPRVTGTVTYRERIALPPTAVIRVRLVDVSRADAPSELIGEQTIAAEGKQVPFAFSIPYDAARIVESHSYAVEARIEVGGTLRFVSDRRYPVITRGAPSEVALVLRGVAAAPR